MNKYHIIPPVQREDQERVLAELRELLKDAIRFREQSDLAVKEVLNTIQAFRKECNL